MMVILFGYPNAGKTYVGKILRKHFNFFFYDTDDLLTPEMKKHIESKEKITDSLLNDYLQRKKEKLFKLKTDHTKLAVAEPLPFRPAQEYMMNLFSDAIFIRVVAPMDLIERRAGERNDHIVDKEYTNKMINISEEPKISHRILNNDGDEEKIKIQLNKILNIA